jgi:hypothetical protein
MVKVMRIIAVSAFALTLASSARAADALSRDGQGSFCHDQSDVHQCAYMPKFSSAAGNVNARLAATPHALAVYTPAVATATPDARRIGDNRREVEPSPKGWPLRTVPDRRCLC